MSETETTALVEKTVFKQNHSRVIESMLAHLMHLLDQEKTVKLYLASTDQYWNTETVKFEIGKTIIEITIREDK